MTYRDRQRELETHSATAQRVSYHMSGREISKILSLSLHTARHHHTEFLFQKNHVYPKGETGTIRTLSEPDANSPEWS